MSWWLGCCHAANIGAEVDVTLEASNGPTVRTWRVDLEKADYGKLGMEITPHENVLRVESIHTDGAVVDFNTSFPKQAIEDGDYIIDVNSVRGNAIKMLAEVRKEIRKGKLTMNLSRSRTFRAEVTKAGSLGVTFGVFSRSLVVQAIKEGPIQEWNGRNPDRQIEVGDQIREVNGAKEIASDILEALKEDGDLSILVLPLGGAGST